MFLKILRAIVQFLSKRKPDAITHLMFRPGVIGALAMELYKGFTIIYLTKPNIKKEQCQECKDLPEGEATSGHDHLNIKELQPIYHVFAKNTIYFGEANTLEELEVLAKKDIDEDFASAKAMYQV